MAENLDMEHFAHPSEPGAKGHQAWLREQRARRNDGDDLAAAKRADHDRTWEKILRNGQHALDSNDPRKTRGEQEKDQ